jgi:hypothetical protein
MKAHNPRIVCKDGFSISVQARESAYCSPRSDHGPYSMVECGYPSSKPKSKRFREFAELCGTSSNWLIATVFRLLPTFLQKRLARPDDFCETVYGYVPVEIVQEELDLHGGIREGRFPE